MHRLPLVVSIGALALLTGAALPAPARATTVDVMSYNINWGAPGGKRLGAIAKVIASSGADVVGLQQVRRFARIAKKGPYRCEDQPARLVAALERLTGANWHWTYAANTTFRQSRRSCKHVTSRPVQEGVVILSRYPIRDAERYRLPYTRGVAKATIDLPGAGLASVYTVHLDSASEGRRVAQAREVARLVGKAGHSPVFLTGDMNAQPGRSPIRILKGAARDSWAEKGKGSGATRNSRIDYVFYRGSAKLESVRVIQNWTSDHRPVIARFRVY